MKKEEKEKEKREEKKRMKGRTVRMTPRYSFKKGSRYLRTCCRLDTDDLEWDGMGEDRGAGNGHVQRNRKSTGSPASSQTCT